MNRPGRWAAEHAHWVTPVLTPDPDGSIVELRRHGFDATRGTTSLRALGESGSPEAVRLIRQVVYLPAIVALSAREIASLACVLNRLHRPA